jgi:hypothetical protein
MQILQGGAHRIVLRLQDREQGGHLRRALEGKEKVEGALNLVSALPRGCNTLVSDIIERWRDSVVNTEVYGVHRGLKG